MGFGVITGGGTDGLYTISLDYGASVRDAMIAERDARIAELEAEIVTVSAEAADARAATAAAGAAMNDAINAYTDALNGIPDGTPEELAANIARTSKEVQEAFELLNRLQNEELVPRLKIQMLRERVSELRAEVVRLTNATLSETRQAWCVDLTEDGTGEAATIEIPGETTAVLIASGCQPWGASDGVMMAREIMSPEQVFWNAAVLPGWQKFKPTYRKGTITALDTSADTASVDLDNATSSAQRLNVNQATALVNVPVSYMACNASAFEVGDRCVVQFQTQDWTSPRVIGFVDNPKACNWVCRNMNYSAYKIACLDIDAATRTLREDIEIRVLINGVDLFYMERAPHLIGVPEYWNSSLRSWACVSELYGTGLYNYAASAEFLLDPPLFGNAVMQLRVAGVAPKPELSVPDRNIYEIAVYVDGTLELNLAFVSLETDAFPTEYGESGEIICPGGISLMLPSGTVTPLNYTLTGCVV